MEDLGVAPKRGFLGQLEARWQKGHFLCIGLDSDPDRLPPGVLGPSRDEPRQVTFNRDVINATHHVACAYKLNLAFYLAAGGEGVEALRDTVEMIHEHAPGVPAVLDGKFGDIGSSNEKYARFAFDVIGADAVTVQPLLGGESLSPFLERHDRGIFVLCRTSNPGAGEFQDLQTAQGSPTARRLYEYIANRVVTDWNESGNCGLVVGATYPAEIANVRAIAELIPILLPGIGAQGGSVRETVDAASRADRSGFLINASRSIVFASTDGDYADAARHAAEELDAEIQDALWP